MYNALKLYNALEMLLPGQKAFNQIYNHTSGLSMQLLWAIVTLMDV